MGLCIRVFCSENALQTHLFNTHKSRDRAINKRLAITARRIKPFEQVTVEQKKKNTKTNDDDDALSDDEKDAIVALLRLSTPLIIVD